jgi:hypothetical protein
VRHYARYDVKSSLLDNDPSYRLILVSEQDTRGASNTLVVVVVVVLLDWRLGMSSTFLYHNIILVSRKGGESNQPLPGRLIKRI